MKNDNNSRVELCLEKAQKYYDDLATSNALPQPDELGYIKVKYQDMRAMLQERYRFGWSAGACYMLASVDMDKKKGIE